MSNDPEFVPPPTATSQRPEPVHASNGRPVRTATWIICAVGGILLVATIVSNYSASRSSNAAARRTSADATPPAPRLEEQAEALPVTYSVDDPEAVFTEMARIQKSEFESAAAFAQRRRDLFAGRRFVFEIVPRQTYNAETQMLTIQLEVYGGPAYLAGVDEDDALFVLKSSRGRSKYTGVNAFGVKVPVEKEEETLFGFAAFPVPSATWRSRIESGAIRGVRYLPLEMKVPPDEALRLVNFRQLRVIYWLSPSARSGATSGRGLYEWKPTITNPTERQQRTHGFLVDVDSVAVWLVNSETRAVLQRTTLQSLLRGRQ